MADIQGKVFIDVEARAKGAQDIKLINDEIQKTQQYAADAQKSGIFGDRAREDFKRDLDDISRGFRNLQDVIQNNERQLGELVNTFKQLKDVSKDIDLDAVPSFKNKIDNLQQEITDRKEIIGLQKRAHEESMQIQQQVSGEGGPGGAGGGFRKTQAGFTTAMGMAKNLATLGMGFNLASNIYTGIREEREFEKWYTGMQLQTGRFAPFQDFPNYGVMAGGGVESAFWSADEAGQGNLRFLNVPPTRGQQREEMLDLITARPENRFRWGMSPYESQAMLTTMAGMPRGLGMQAEESLNRWGAMGYWRNMETQQMLPLMETLGKTLRPDEDFATIASLITSTGFYGGGGRYGRAGEQRNTADFVMALNQMIPMAAATQTGLGFGNISSLSNMLGIIGEDIPMFRGQGALPIVQGLQQMIQAPGGGEAGTAFTMQALGLGRGKSLIDVMKRMETGILDPRNIKDIYGFAKQQFGEGSDLLKMFLSEQSGLSITQVEEMINTGTFERLGKAAIRTPEDVKGSKFEQLLGLGPAPQLLGTGVMTAELERKGIQLGIGANFSDIVTTMNQSVNALLSGIETLTEDFSDVGQIFTGLSNIFKTFLTDPGLHAMISIGAAVSAGQLGLDVLTGKENLTLGQVGKRAATTLGIIGGMGILNKIYSPDTSWGDPSWNIPAGGGDITGRTSSLGFPGKLMGNIGGTYETMIQMAKITGQYSPITSKSELAKLEGVDPELVEAFQQVEWLANQGLLPGIPVGTDIAATSGFRKGAITTSGKPSRHGTGEAFDIGQYSSGLKTSQMQTVEGVLINFGFSVVQELVRSQQEKTQRAPYAPVSHIQSLRGGESPGYTGTTPIPGPQGALQTNDGNTFVFNINLDGHTMTINELIDMYKAQTNGQAFSLTG